MLEIFFYLLYTGPEVRHRPLLSIIAPPIAFSSIARSSILAVFSSWNCVLVEVRSAASVHACRADCSVTNFKRMLMVVETQLTEIMVRFDTLTPAVSRFGRGW